MKNGKLIALILGVLVVLAGTLYTVKHLQDQEKQAEATYGTEKPRITDIVLKTLASGSVQPRRKFWSSLKCQALYARFSWRLEMWWRRATCWLRS